MSAADPIYLHDTYPDLFRCLAVAAAHELRAWPEPHAIAFEIAEGPRRKLGGNLFRMPAWRPAIDNADLFGQPEHYPRPDAPPAVTFNTTGSAIDLIAYVRAWTAWTLARHAPDADGHTIHQITDRIVDRFHKDTAGRDQTYVPKGQSFDHHINARRMWDRFTGHNYAELAVAFGVTEMRARQVIEEVRRDELHKRQSRLDLDIPPPAAKKARSRAS